MTHAAKTAEQHRNVYHNSVITAVPNPARPAPDAVDELFAQSASAALALGADQIRGVVGCHQSAIAIVAEGVGRRFASAAQCRPSTRYGLTM